MEVPGSRHEVICEIRLFQKVPEPSGKGLCAPAVGYNLRPAHLVVLSNVCSLFLFLLQICTQQTGVPSSRPGGMGTGPWGHAGPPRAAAAGSRLGVPLPHHREAWFEANPPLCKCARLPCPRPVHTRLTVRRARRHSRPGAPGARARLRPPGRGSLLDAAGGGPGRSAAHAQQMAGLCSQHLHGAQTGPPEVADPDTDPDTDGSGRGALGEFGGPTLSAARLGADATCVDVQGHCLAPFARPPGGAQAGTCRTGHGHGHGLRPPSSPTATQLLR